MKRNLWSGTIAASFLLQPLDCRTSKGMPTVKAGEAVHLALRGGVALGMLLRRLRRVASFGWVNMSAPLDTESRSG